MSLVATSACGDDGGSVSPSPLPDDYETTFTEVRDCRRSADHDLNFIRIFADDSSAAAYMLRDRPFPTGSVIVKQEHDPSDDTCSDIVVGWTVMVKEAEGSADLGWSWHRISEQRQPVEILTGPCVSCHTDCGAAPDGFDGTCSIPP